MSCRRLLAVYVTLAAGLALPACGGESEIVGEAPPTLQEQVRKVDRTPGARSQETLGDLSLSTPELIGVRLDGALARLAQVERNARRAFETGRVDRVLGFDVRTEVVPGFGTTRKDLIVSGYMVGTEPGAKVIASGARVTLYAVPEDRFERAPQHGADAVGAL